MVTGDPTYGRNAAAFWVAGVSLLLLAAAVGLVVWRLRGRDHCYSASSPYIRSPSSSGPDDASALQGLLDHTKSGGTLRLSRDYRVTRTIRIDRALTLDGQGHRLTLLPAAGTVPALLVFALGPSELCRLTCSEWGQWWMFKPPSLSNVTVENLYVTGNLDQDEKQSASYALRERYCDTCGGSMTLAGGLRKASADSACSTYKDLETSTSYDGLGTASAALSPIQCVGCSGCSLTGDPCAEPVSAPCASLRASSVVVVNASNVTLRGVRATNGRSASISAFFGCTGLLLDSCVMHGSRYDGFGPDSLKDAVLRNCSFGTAAEKNAAISVSAGAGASPGPNWYGKIVVQGCTIGANWPIGVYCNSPNVFEVHDSQDILASTAVSAQKGLVLSPDISGSVRIAQPCKGHYDLAPGLAETFAPDWCTISASSELARTA